MSDRVGMFDPPFCEHQINSTGNFLGQGLDCVVHREPKLDQLQELGSLLGWHRQDHRDVDPSTVFTRTGDPLGFSHETSATPLGASGLPQEDQCPHQCG